MSAGTRYPNRPEEELAPEELEVTKFLKEVLTHSPPPHDHMIFPEGRLLGHFNTFTYRPNLVQPLFSSIQRIYGLQLQPNVREVALFAVCAFFKSPYQAYVHNFTAKHNGSTLSEEQLATLGRGQKPGDLKPEEAIAWEVVRELHGAGKLTDETFNKSVELIGKDETLNLIVYVGMSTFTALIAKGADVGLPYGKIE